MRVGWVVVTLALVAVGVACGDGGEASRPPAAISVVATTTQIQDFARQVGGERVHVVGLLPANVDPHDYEPTPRDVARIAGADLVLEHGLRLDAWMDEIVKQSGTHAPVVVVTQGITPLPGTEPGEEHSGDPHVWFDVANAKIMVADVRDALIAVDPAGAAGYVERADAYLGQLDALDGWIRQQTATLPEGDRKLVTNHDAFGYYVHAYGLTFVGSVVPSLDAQSQPSARQISTLVENIKAQGVNAVFTESSLNPQLARQIGREAGVSVVDDLYGDALGPPGSGADTYIGMMRTDTTLIVDALR
jgi:zinc/manganese transport system substrate-binding protein/manganese/iron transport system substrate-binding protein